MYLTINNAYLDKNKYNSNNTFFGNWYILSVERHNGKISKE
jgi:hypothetical protein